MTVFGAVNKNGTIKSGIGFIPHRNHNGEYTINFIEPFKKKPKVAVTQKYPTRLDIHADSIFSQDYAEITSISNNEITVKTGGINGISADSNFYFIAIGE